MIKRIFYIILLILPYKGLSQIDFHNYNKFNLGQKESVNNFYISKNKQKSKKPNRKIIKRLKKRAQRRLRFFRGTNV